MTPTAYWPLPSLLRSLARAGWGELATAEHRGLRGLLRALSDVLDDTTATGATTAHQLADASGYSERWVRDRLGELERLGLVEWHRGGVAAGRPQPSIVRVVKARLVELVLAARPELARRVTERAKTTAERINTTLRTATTRPRRGHRRRSAHAEVATAPHPLRGGITPPSGGRGVRPAPAPDWRAEQAAAAAAAVPPPRLRIRGGKVVSLA